MAMPGSGRPEAVERQPDTARQPNADAARLSPASPAASQPGLPGLALWTHRGLIRRLVAQEVQRRYRGTFLGLLWAFAIPLATLTVYTFAFAVVLRVRWSPGADASNPYEFPLVLLAGLIPFNVFAEVVTRAPGLVLAVPNYVKKVIFPLEVLAPVAVGHALVNSLIGLIVLLLGELVLRGSVPWTLVFLPLLYLPLTLLCLGLAWGLSSIGVFVRDVSAFITVVVQLLMFMTPIFYPLATVPERYRAWLLLNPLTGVVEGFRDVVLWGRAPRWDAWAISLLTGAIVAAAGYAWFQRTKRGFVDVL